MVIHNTKNVRTGKVMASRFRKRGFNATVSKTKMGVKVSVSRPGKNKKR